MKGARILGNYVQKLAKEQKVTIPELSALLGCSEQQVNSFFKGRFLASFKQLEALAHQFGIGVQDLIKGDENHYNKTVVHCMEDFEDTESREFILDIIDNYMDIQNALVKADFGIVAVSSRSEFFNSDELKSDIPRKIRKQLAHVKV